METIAKIGITGLPGAGKTYAVRKVVEMLEAEDLVVGGMMTEPIIEDGKKNGFCDRGLDE